MVAVLEVGAAADRARSHGYDVLGVGHLVVKPLDAFCHLAGHGAGDNHQIRLAGRGAEFFRAEAGDVETPSADGHHLDRAAGQAKAQRPQAIGPAPVDEVVHAGDDQAFFESVLYPRHRSSIMV